VRIVDCFTDVILFARKLSRADIRVESSAEALASVKGLLDQAKVFAESHDLSSDMYEQALFPVVAFVDELFMCSKWEFKND